MPPRGPQHSHQHFNCDSELQNRSKSFYFYVTEQSNRTRVIEYKTCIQQLCTPSTCSIASLYLLATPSLNQLLPLTACTKVLWTVCTQNNLAGKGKGLKIQLDVLSNTADLQIQIYVRISCKWDVGLETAFHSIFVHQLKTFSTPKSEELK